MQQNSIYFINARVLEKKIKIKRPMAHNAHMSSF